MDEETVEFNVAHNRKYSTDHLWYQEKDDRLMIGVSEFLRLEIGDVLRVIYRKLKLKLMKEMECSRSGLRRRKNHSLHRFRA